MNNTKILVETEGLTHQEWLEYRRMGIGGSDASILLGINKWKSELELWFEKTGQSSDQETDNEAMEWGRIMEPVIRNHYQEITGKKTVEVHAILQNEQYPYLIADIDGLTEDDDGNPAILEIKTASEYKRSEWENDIPPYYRCQVEHYMMVTGLEKAYVAVLIGGNTFKVFEVDADVEIQRMLLTIETDFWDKVVNNVRPALDGSDAAKEFLDKTYTGGIKETIELPDEAAEYITQYLTASQKEDEAKAEKQEASNKIKELIGNNEKASCGDHIISWTSVSSERLDSKKLKEEQPEMYAKYTKSSNSRRFSIK